MSRRKKTMAAHPGEILRTEFMEPLGITAYQLAKALHLPGVYEIVRGQRAISADVALRLGKYFGMTPQFFLDESPERLRSSTGSEARHACEN
jgi:addiction module HigA family antidote